MSDENVMKIPADRTTLNAVQKENQAELRLTDAKGRQIEGTFKKAETYIKGQNEVLDLAGIEEGARLDQRNEAYASVAASLGMKKIVPQARALAIRDPEGHDKGQQDRTPSVQRQGNLSIKILLIAHGMCLQKNP